MTCNDLTDDLLQAYLDKRLLPEATQAIKLRIQTNRACWDKWQQFRWEQARHSPEYQELQTYYGSAFKVNFDASWALAEEWNRRRPQIKAAIEAFYKETSHYVYNLMIWEASGQRPNYVARAVPYLSHYGAHHILDFGCGIGTDGLKLMNLGYRVTFYDFDNPSIQFLRWRLAQRGLAATIVHPHILPDQIPRFDTLWLMDVIEHLPDIESELSPFLETARLVLYDIEDPSIAGGRHPFHIPQAAARFDSLLNDYHFRRDISSTTLNVWYKM